MDSSKTLRLTAVFLTDRTQKISSKRHAVIRVQIHLEDMFEWAAEQSENIFDEIFLLVQTRFLISLYHRVNKRNHGQ